MLRRGSLVVLYVLGPYVIDKALARLQLWLQTQDNWPSGLHARTREILLTFIPFLRTLLLYVHRAHLALFYLNGIFYHIAKRLTGVQYLLVRSSLRNDGSRPTYRLLGYLSIIQLSITLALAVYQHLKSAKSLERLVLPDKQASTSTTTTTRGTKCALCLERLRDNTATPCGHLFCWSCITEWCGSKPECPLCREPVQLSRLVFLHHYEPT
ncbi:peroxisome biogenesis factor 10 [Desmophyllum pertusum]|uniref:RING-type E3 ubiquitin transferase n=1 Tax=Desmophyllum pertusum TaxID=174260 RepID=A0A9W9YBN6_9CNID|nr:peroxisome biogenesis factor 10 [Desmophyllum pertusum]